MPCFWTKWKITTQKKIRSDHIMNCNFISTRHKSGIHWILYKWWWLDNIKQFFILANAHLHDDKRTATEQKNGRYSTSWHTSHVRFEWHWPSLETITAFVSHKVQSSDSRSFYGLVNTEKCNFRLWTMLIMHN